MGLVPCPIPSRPVGLRSCERPHTALGTNYGMQTLSALPPSRPLVPRNFRFASYLKKCEQSVVLNLAGIKEGVWVALILLVGAELFIKGLFGEAKSNEVSLRSFGAGRDGAGLIFLLSSLQGSCFMSRACFSGATALWSFGIVWLFVVWTLGEKRNVRPPPPCLPRVSRC